MKDVFMEVYAKEKNENTALILMLGIINENLIKIQNILKTKNNEKAELTIEDYVE